MIGQTLNKRFKISSRLGKGAMGTVYLATDTQNGKEVALKIIASDLAVEPEMLERFKREGEALRQLKHPNIVGFIDAFQHEETYVIVMEYIAGGNLYELLKKGALPVEQARQIALDLCDALIRAHRLNIIHRDIKPENILIDEDGTPKLADFGVARLSEGTRMTRSGMQVGTPYYMSPEAWKGETLDAQADIWSVGVVLFEMLSGKVPFEGDTGHKVMTKVMTVNPPDLKKLRSDAPADFVKIINRMLTRDKKRRYESIREVGVDLERSQRSATPKPGDGTRVHMPKIKASGYLNWYIIGLGLLAVGILITINSFSSFDSAPTEDEINNEAVLTEEPNTTIPGSSNSLEGNLGYQVSQADGMIQLNVPAGEFIMGRDEGNEDSQPAHTIYLDVFWIDQTEVTNAMYANCVEDGNCIPPPDTLYFSDSTLADHPVVIVSWSEAYGYCQWAGRRLPTEAEWEKSARGEAGNIYPWGNDAPDEGLLNYNDNISTTTAVGSYLNGASVYGALDMAGNVSEWVNSLFLPYPYIALNSELLEAPGERVLRGGSFDYDETIVRSDARGAIDPSSAFNDLGFRCAQSP